MAIQRHLYGDGRVEYTTPDGRKWREATSGRELADLPPEHLVYVTGFSIKPKGEWDGLVIAGSPFLPSIAHLLPVYIEDTEPAAAAGSAQDQETGEPS